MKYFSKKNKGFSLVEILVAVGIMTVVMFGTMTLISSQQRETKSLTEILASLDLQKTLIGSLADGSVCTYILNNPIVLTFDSAALPQTITPTLPIYANVASGVVVAQVGQTASVYSPSLVVKTINLVITSGFGTTYKGNWIVDFDETKSSRAHKPIAITAILTVDNTVPATAKITACMGIGSNSGNLFRTALGLGAKWKNYLKCTKTGPTPGVSIYNLATAQDTVANQIKYNHSTMQQNTFNSDGTWNNGGAGGAEDCDGKTIDQLGALGLAFD